MSILLNPYRFGAPPAPPAVTLLGSVFNTTNGVGGSPKQVTATPAVGDLIIIAAAHSDNTTNAAPTDDQGGTYSNCDAGGAGTGFVKRSSLDRGGLWVRTSAISSAVSTVFSHDPGTTTGGGLAVIKITNMNKFGNSAILQYKDPGNQAVDTTPTATFDATPQPGNPIIGMCFNGTNAGDTVTPRAGYTELRDGGYATPNMGLEIMSIDSGETSATIAWGSTCASLYGIAVAELDAS